MPEPMWLFVDTWRSRRASELNLLDELHGLPVHERGSFVEQNLDRVCVFSVNHTFTPSIVTLLGRPDPQQPLADDVVNAACKLLCHRPLVFEADRLHDVLAAIGSDHGTGKVPANVLGGLLYMASILCGMNIATRIVRRVEFNKLSDAASKTGSTKAVQGPNRSAELPQPYATIMSLKAHLESCRGEHRSGVQLEGSLADVMLPLRILLLLHRFSVNARADPAEIGGVLLTLEMWDNIIRQHLLHDLQTLWVYRLGDFIRRFAAKDGSPNADAVRRLLRALAAGFAHAVPSLSNNSILPFCRVGDWQTLYAGWDGHAVYVNVVRLPDKRVLIEVHDLWQPGQDAMTFPRADLQHEVDKNQWLPYPVALVLDDHKVWLGNLDAELPGGACFRYVHRILEGVHARAQWKKEPAKKTVYGIPPVEAGSSIKSGDSCRNELAKVVREFCNFFLDQGSVSNCVVHNHSAARSHCEVSASNHILDAELDAVNQLFPHNDTAKGRAVSEFVHADALTDDCVPEWHTGDPGAKLARGGPLEAEHNGAASMPAAARPSSVAAGGERTDSTAEASASTHHDERTRIIAKFALMGLEDHVGTRNDVTFVTKVLSLICSALETDDAIARESEMFFSKCAVIAASICDAMDDPSDSPGSINLLSEWLRDIVEHFTGWLKHLGLRAAQAVLAAPAARRVSGKTLLTNVAALCEDLGQLTGRHAASALRSLMHAAKASEPARRWGGLLTGAVGAAPALHRALAPATRAAAAMLDRAVADALQSDAVAPCGAATAGRPASFREAVLSGMRAGVCESATSLWSPHGSSVSDHKSKWLHVHCRGVHEAYHPLLVAAVGIFLDIVPTVSTSVTSACRGASSRATGDLVLYFSTEDAEVSDAIQSLSKEHSGGAVSTLLGRLVGAVPGDVSEPAAFDVRFEVEHAAGQPKHVDRPPMGPGVEQWVSLIRATVMADADALASAVFRWLEAVASAPRTTSLSPLLQRFSQYAISAEPTVRGDLERRVGVPGTAATMPLGWTTAFTQGCSVPTQRPTPLWKELASVAAEAHPALPMRLPRAIAPKFSAPGAAPLADPGGRAHQPAMSAATLESSVAKALASLSLDPPTAFHREPIDEPSPVTSTPIASSVTLLSSTRRWVDVARSMPDSATSGADNVPRSALSASEPVRITISRKHAGRAGLAAPSQQVSSYPSLRSGLHPIAATRTRTLILGGDTRPTIHVRAALTRESRPMSAPSASHSASASSTSQPRSGHSDTFRFPSAARLPSTSVGGATVPMRSTDSQGAAILPTTGRRPGPPGAALQISLAAVTDDGAATVAATRRRRGAGPRRA